ncbi:MAG TPA: aminotransferase class V-fold PLP-dependent enzyme [Planctomycetota bacterium]|nr:aminotransferase class V-fold PLP-dependent enzyme [Planctomycetota bacterium]
MIETYLYLDNAATSWPKPDIVYETLDRFTRTTAANPGRSGHRMAVEAEERISDCRGRLARLIRAESPERIAFTLNGTDALNIAIKGVVKAGDHVVTSVLEHNSINRPLGRMEKEGRIQVTRCPADGAGIISPDDVRRALRPNTRLVAITHCPNALGVVQPVEEYGRISREAGALLLVDAAQSIGVVDIDVHRMNIDLLAFPGHKALFGLMGTGALYVRKGLDLAFFREGGVGYKAEVELHPEEMPYRLEGGTPNAHGIVALGAGLKFIEEEGLERIRRHEQGLALKFIARLREDRRFVVHAGNIPERQLGPVSLSIRGAPPDEVGAALDREYRIACRPGLHCAPGAHKHLGTFPKGTVRFSFGYFNTEEHVDRAAQALESIAQAYRA